MYEWIDEKVSKPEPYDWVLVAARNTSRGRIFYSIALWTGKEWELLNHYGPNAVVGNLPETLELYDDEITHWQEFPRF